MKISHDIYIYIYNPLFRLAHKDELDIHVCFHEVYTRHYNGLWESWSAQPKEASLAHGGIV